MMNLKVLLPFGVFKSLDEIERIVVETDQGSFGLLPKRLDCVASIVPGILTYQRRGEEDVYVAVDEGVLVKTGKDVSISVRHAVAGNDLNELHNTVERDFLQQSIQDKNVHSVYQKMESDFIHRLSAFRNDT
ncbi:F0F1 ATP synthase subunit epsilon [Zhongshania sp. BJYM1]|uniref:F0F1 ATP synthase subunit epsilon n=1 Tax=Zhongshania aquatica TaxID=2965069 RepID=UPI0022B54E5D|nr:F0F1 ATP synthase subunit epsilon [Marortus sp. BJYM1]